MADTPEYPKMSMASCSAPNTSPTTPNTSSRRGCGPATRWPVVGSQWEYPGFKDAHHPETWNPRLRLVEGASLSKAPEVDLFPRWLRIATRLSGKTTAGARKARILRYRF